MTPESKFFFLHVMKTGGRALRRNIEPNFRPDQVFPARDTDSDAQVASRSLEYLTSLSPQRRARTRVYIGHFPYVAVELLGVEAITLTVLRDPVERTLSYLRASKRNVPGHRDLSLQQIYEDRFHYTCLIRDHQTKVFSLTVEDHPESVMDVINVDAGRLALAKRNLEQIDVLGLQERFEELLAELEKRFGWRRAPFRRRPAATSGGAPPSFRRRIADDNQIDIEFYEHGRTLYESRRRPTTSARIGS